MDTPVTDLSDSSTRMWAAWHGPRFAGLHATQAAAVERNARLAEVIMNALEAEFPDDSADRRARQEAMLNRLLTVSPVQVR
jgi:hypothetical protein